jgi:hypothetical protein
MLQSEHSGKGVVVSVGLGISTQIHSMEGRYRIQPEMFNWRYSQKHTLKSPSFGITITHLLS